MSGPAYQKRSTHWRHWCSYVAPLGWTGIPCLLASSLVFQHKHEWVTMATENKTRLKRYLQLSCPLARQSLWNVRKPQLKYEIWQNPAKTTTNERRLGKIWSAYRNNAASRVHHLWAHRDATLPDKAIGDLVLISFYYLLRIGEYTCKSKRNNSKQTVQFKFEDVTFFLIGTLHSDLSCLPQMVSDLLITSANGTTLKLDNQKNGWNGACDFQELCALVWCYLHIW